MKRKPRIRYAFLFAVFAAYPFSAAAPDGTLLIDFINSRFAARSTGNAPKSVFDCQVQTDILAARVFADYGSVFAAVDKVVLPDRCIFARSEDVEKFQKSLAVRSTIISGSQIELQSAALSALTKARDELAALAKTVTPLDGAVAGRRSYADSVRLWNSRFYPALEYWIQQGIVSPDAELQLRNAALVDQSREVLRLESRGYQFGTGRVKSIFSSTAPPGTSQHLFLLAFDVVEYRDRDVLRALNRNGWYQTIVGDEPHFTFIGERSEELSKRGVKSVTADGFTFWVPRLSTESGNAPTPLR